jgi:hypothetical protein
MSMAKMHSILLEVLDEELEHCKQLETAWCIFGVGVPSAIANSKSKAFLKLERRMKMKGPFTKYEEERTRDRT